jgi:CheY-like chemotaxis protein
MGKTILLVDDDPNILDTAREILENAGYTVIAEGTGAGALAKLKSSSVDLAVLDFNLPDTQGVDLAIRAKRIRPQISIILLTGEGSVDLGPAKDAIDILLTKPVNPTQLIQVIHDKVDS